MLVIGVREDYRPHVTPADTLKSSHDDMLFEYYTTTQM